MQSFTRLIVLASLTLLAWPGGCAEEAARDRDFHTSGSREADQRAEQRIARTRQIRGEKAGGEGLFAEENQPLYDRLGGDEGIGAIVDDFVDRALADPRVNWRREGVRSGGFLGIRDKSMTWQAGAQDIARLKKHIADFLAVSTGGPTEYRGQDLADAHEGMKITNAQFDAAVGDLKASMDRLAVPTKEQKELLAVVETTRPHIVEVR
jgi:hemoglobin